MLGWGRWFGHSLTLPGKGVFPAETYSNALPLSPPPPKPLPCKTGIPSSLLGGWRPVTRTGPSLASVSLEPQLHQVNDHCPEALHMWPLLHAFSKLSWAAWLEPTDCLSCLAPLPIPGCLSANPGHPSCPVLGSVLHSLTF